MKWPKALVLIRHDVSAFNAMKGAKRRDPLYAEFLAEFSKLPQGTHCRELAQQIHEHYRLGFGDHSTPLASTSKGRVPAKKLGARLCEDSSFPRPDVIFVSPYLRTQETLARVIEGWPELRRVRVVVEDRIREQEHGLALLYNDWRIFHVLHPDQRLLCAREGSYWYRYPQGENVPDIRLRNHSWLGTLIRDFAGKTVWAVTHHLNILATRANLERWTAEDFVDCDHNDKPANCGVTVYIGNPRAGRAGKLELKCYNRQYV